MDLLPLQGEVAGNGTIKIAVPEIKPQSKLVHYLRFKLNNPTDNLPVIQDDILKFNARIEGVFDELNYANNNIDIEQIVINSYDPNNITCLQGDTYQHMDEIEPIYYTINFENNGTAPASIVEILNPIDAQLLSIDQVEIIDQSHEVEALISKDTFRFIFHDINLDYQVGENRGYVVYAIHPNENLSESDIINNQAEIYFDFNPAIITNLHKLSHEPLSSIHNHQTYNSIHIYPNPNNGFLNINGAYDYESIDILDTQSRKIFSSGRIDTGYDISSLANGIYFIKLNTIDNKSKGVGRIILQK